MLETWNCENAWSFVRPGSLSQRKEEAFRFFRGNVPATPAVLFQMSPAGGPTLRRQVRLGPRHLSLQLGRPPVSRARASLHSSADARQNKAAAHSPESETSLHRQ